MFDEPEWEDDISNANSGNSDTITKSVNTAVSTSASSESVDTAPAILEDPVPTKKRKLEEEERKEEGKAEPTPARKPRCKEMCCNCGDCHNVVDIFHLLHIMFPNDKSMVLKALAYSSDDDDSNTSSATGSNAICDKIRAAFRILNRIAIFETLSVGTRYEFISEGKDRAKYELEKAFALGIGRALGLETRIEETDNRERVVGYVPQTEVSLFDRSRLSKSLLRASVSSVLSLSPLKRDALTQQLVSAAEKNDVEAALATIATAQMFNVGLDAAVIKGPLKLWPCNGGTKWCSFKETYLNDDYRAASYLSSIPNCEFSVLYDGSFNFNTQKEDSKSISKLKSGTFLGAFSSLIHSFAGKLGMTPVSAVVHVEVIAPKQKEDIPAELFLARHSESIQRYLMFTHPTTYFSLSNSASPFSTAFSRRLNHLKIVRCAPTLQVRYSLNASSLSSSRSRQVTSPTPCASIRVGDVIYFWGVMPPPAVPSALFAEIARAFSPVGAHDVGLSALLADLSGGVTSPASLAELPPFPAFSDIVWRPCSKSCPCFKDGCNAAVATLVAPVESMDPTEALMGSKNADSQMPLYEVTVFTLKGGPQKFSPEGTIHKDENKVVGRMGEEVAYRFLTEQFAGTGSVVTWPNEVLDGGLPYDLFVTHAGGEVQYYEVKSTSSSVNISFPVTTMELDFAKRHRKNYHILRVLRVGKPDVTVVKLTNPYALARQRNIHLWFEIDTENK